VEFETWWQPERDIQLSANFSLSDPDDTPFRENAIPDRQAYARIDWQFRPNWNWNLQANWFGKTYRGDGDTRPAINAYTLMDTTVRYGGIKHWEFALSAKNLLDEDARSHTRSAIPDDLPLPGRSLFAEVRLYLDGLLK
jgi:iron complex outermembrane receptor protein